jgi:endonuclease YncB( thermonuclease family)
MMHTIRIARTFWVLLLAVLTAGAASLGATEKWTGRVVGVHDGDTLTVLVDSREMKVRLHGIDAAELAQSHGKEAKRAMSALVFGEEVVVQVVDTDRYRRKVARVLVHDRDVGLALVRAGQAWWYQRYAPRDATLRAGESEARAHRRGLWRETTRMAPWDWRRASAAARRLFRSN